mmetsp:Transcript_8968/g.21260  ORF Transcript_8968/g.21260 Transcript_8968/m.21260 type:complete len:263 (+) Transcript_8968:1208-1996(+)
MRQRTLLLLKGSRRRRWHAYRSLGGWIAGLQRRQRRRHPGMKRSLGRRCGASFARVGARRGSRGCSVGAASPLFLPLCNLLLRFGVVYHHVARLRPLSLEVPYMTSSIWQLYQSLCRGPKSFFRVSLAEEFHEAEATRLPGRLVNDQVNSLHTAELRKLSLDVCLRSLPRKVCDQKRLPTPNRITDVCGHLLRWVVMDLCCILGRLSSCTLSAHVSIVPGRPVTLAVTGIIVLSLLSSLSAPLTFSIIVCHAYGLVAAHPTR